MTNKDKRKMKCARFLNRKGECGLPVKFTFVSKTHDGINIAYGLCEQHSKQIGVYHVDKQTL